MILQSPRGAKKIGAALPFAFLVLNGVFITIHGMTTGARGDLRIPMLVLVLSFIVALMFHVQLTMKFESA
jgi:hypothetical protein